MTIVGFLQLTGSSKLLVLTDWLNIIVVEDVKYVLKNNSKSTVFWTNNFQFFLYVPCQNVHYLE